MPHVYKARWRDRACFHECGSSLVLCFLTVGIIMAEGCLKDEISEAVLKVSKGSAQFTTNVYKVLSSKDGNIFISPLSVEVVLALAYMGAAGSTAKQIASALYLPPDREDIKAGFAEILGSLKSTGSLTLEIANKIFSQSGFEILSEYKAIAKDSFLSGAEELDFSDSEPSRNIINSWVEKETRNKIRDLIPSGLLDETTRLVLVNAVYFKGLWEKQFSADKTKPDKFHLNSRENKEIPMMHKTANFGYLESEELRAAILEMPYQDRNISMFIILPHDIDGISELEKKLATADLSTVLKNIPTREVRVSIPKFKLEETISFNDILKQLGMTSMFSAKEADFSGISGTRELFVSSVMQKTFIEVNEGGSEAAAATGMVFMKCSLNFLQPPNFIADHPFVFVLAEANAVLFVGRFSNPV
ncbi:leukocyte elastase inhibitor-like isoform X4 [Zootermopsis nevadensis]|uniref:leukocyte elastase inhibitor-like isoform X4 n=1 Tax=Zootermopsis nevadensis TaxID=136037 RepID=UPI000B8E6547|nr:leukocyte elastase inhibitor-like isoform X4 [Zootermopsis nevadensis]